MAKTKAGELAGNPAVKQHHYGRLWQSTLGQIGLSETQRFLFLALLIGVFSGLLVVLFHITIDFISWNSLGALAGRFRFGRLLSPALGALIAVVIVRIAEAESIKPKSLSTVRKDLFRLRRL